MSTLKNLAAPRRFLTNQLLNISRYHELQQKYDDISVGNQTLEEQIHFKDNEIEVSNTLSSDMLWLCHWNPKYTTWLFSCPNFCTDTRVALCVGTYRKTHSFVTSQDMFALLCSQFVDKLSTTWWPFAIQGFWLNRNVTSCSNNLLSFCNSTTLQNDNVTKWQHCYKPICQTGCEIFTCVYTV